jgi:tetratricopeptide (TPR) repeat protein
VTAKVNYRKFAWWNTQWAYAGVRDPAQPVFALSPAHDDGRWEFTADTSRVSGMLKAIPDVPVVEMAVDTATLQVLPKDAPAPEAAPMLDRSVRERWNDYGIGLLLQGDIKGAEAAFLKVTQMEPEYADGWVNVARTRIQEGNMAGAEEVLRKALEVDPNLAKTHFFLGTALRALGRYDEALVHLRRASALYPRDRVVLNQLGRVLFLKRQYQDAIVEFRKVLKIDPEDLQAHYNLINDGLADIYLTALGRSRLFRNTGGARFTDVTDRAGVGQQGFSTSAAWVDYDRDGWLDLFVLRYVDWSIETDLFCTLDGKTKSYCTPESYKGQSAALYRNRGNGTFEASYHPDSAASRSA